MHGNHHEEEIIIRLKFKGRSRSQFVIGISI